MLCPNNTLLQILLQLLVKKRSLCASASLPAWVPIVKLNKPVCTGDALTYGGEHNSEGKGGKGGREEMRKIVVEGGGE